MSARGSAVAGIVTIAGCIIATAGVVDISSSPAARVPQEPPVIPPLVLDAIVLDRQGAPIADLQARDFDVLVDGKPRVGVAIMRLYRGPGSAGLVAARQATMPGERPPLAEPSRAIVFLVDQGSFLPGDERRARPIVENCLGLVGLADRVMVLTLPDLAGLQTLTSDRDSLRQSLGQFRAMRASYAATSEAQALGAATRPDQAARADERLSGTPDRTGGDPRGTGVRADTLAKLDGLMAGEGASTTEAVSPPANKAHAVAMLGALRQVLDGLRSVPGSKTVLLMSAGLHADEASVELKAAEDAAVSSFTRIYAVQVPTPAPRFSDAGRTGLVNLARTTGGALVTLSDKPAQSLQRMMSELSFSYLLMLSPQAGDADPGLRTILVRTKRKDAAIRTSASTAPGRLLPAPPAPPPPSPGPAATVPPPGAAEPKATAKAPAGNASPRPARRDPALEAVLARVSEYVYNYGREFTAIVAEEVYEQKVSRKIAIVGGSAAKQPTSRRLVSDYLLVRVPGDEGWTPFRDVFEVDGVKVRDRDDRLKRLFLEAPTEKAAENANKIWLESARYNIGGVWRTINVPTLPLVFVTSPSQPKFEFRKRGEPTEAGIRAWEIDYLELTRPTHIRTRTGENLPASGTLWVDPVSGRVLRTVVRAAGATITVTYRPRDEMAGLWLPATMEEDYDYPAERIQGKATYSNFRRFQVFTEEKLKPPKRP